MIAVPPTALDFATRRFLKADRMLKWEPSMMRLQALHAMDATFRDAQIAAVPPSDFTVKAAEATAGNARLLRRRRLIAAAAELFSHQGYQRTGSRDISHAAGCSAGAIRREFGGKAGLLEEVIRASGICAEMAVPEDFGRFSLEEVISRLTTWQVNRMREQRKRLQSLFPLDRFDPVVLHVAGKLSLCGSTEVLHDRLRKHRLGDRERQFLVYTIQAIGFRLGWSRCEKPDQVASHVRQIARTLAGSNTAAHR